MKARRWVMLILGVSLMVVGCHMGGKLNLQLSDNEFYFDKSGLDPVVTASNIESEKFEEIKELQINTHITDIELIGNTSDHYTITIENMESGYVSLMKVEANQETIGISNKLLYEKPIGILDDASSRAKVIIKGPVEKIEKISLENNIGSINIIGAELNHTEISASLMNVDFVDSEFKKLALNLELADLRITSTSVYESNIDLKTSRIFGEEIEFKGENKLNLSVVEGQIGLKNYNEIFNEETPNTIRLTKDLSRIEFIDER